MQLRQNAVPRGRLAFQLHPIEWLEQRQMLSFGAPYVAIRETIDPIPTRFEVVRVGPASLAGRETSVVEETRDGLGGGSADRRLQSRVLDWRRGGGKWIDLRDTSRYRRSLESGANQDRSAENESSQVVLARNLIKKITSNYSPHDATLDNVLQAEQLLDAADSFWSSPSFLLLDQRDPQIESATVAPSEVASGGFTVPDTPRLATDIQASSSFNSGFATAETETDSSVAVSAARSGVASRDAPAAPAAMIVPTLETPEGVGPAVISSELSSVDVHFASPESARHAARYYDHWPYDTRFRNGTEKRQRILNNLTSDTEEQEASDAESSGHDLRPEIADNTAARGEDVTPDHETLDSEELQPTQITETDGLAESEIDSSVQLAADPSHEPAPAAGGMVVLSGVAGSSGDRNRALEEQLDTFESTSGEAIEVDPAVGTTRPFDLLPPADQRDVIGTDDIPSDGVLGRALDVSKVDANVRTSAAVILVSASMPRALRGNRDDDGRHVASAPAR